MKSRNLSKGTIMFPLKANEEVEVGKVYEIVSGKAQKVASAVTGTIIGVAIGGDKIEVGKIMLDIDPTAMFKEAYESAAPTIGSFVDGCKLVVTVDTEAKTFEYLLRVEE